MTRSAGRSGSRTALASTVPGSDRGGPGTRALTSSAIPSAATDSTTKATRQLATSAMSLASGVPTTMPSVAPPNTTAIARPNRSSLTRSATWAFAVAHNKPTAAPPSRRAPTTKGYDGARAVPADETARATRPATISERRSMRLVSRASGGLATTTVNAQMATSWPVRDTGTPSPLLIGTRMAVGSISAVTMTSVAAPRVSRAGHGSCSRAVLAGRMVVVMRTR